MLPAPSIREDRPALGGDLDEGARTLPARHVEVERRRGTPRRGRGRRKRTGRGSGGGVRPGAGRRDGRRVGINRVEVPIASGVLVVLLFSRIRGLDRAAPWRFDRSY